MEEDEAHRLYTLFARVNEGAKHKQGLGFGPSRSSPDRKAGPSERGILSSFVRSTTSFGAETTRKFAALHDDSGDDDVPAKRPRKERLYDDDDVKRERSYARRGAADTLHTGLGAEPHRSRSWRYADDRDEEDEDNRNRLRQRLGAAAACADPQRRVTGNAGSGAGSAGKGQASDYADLIPGYDSMNPVEKLRARTRVALKQADARVRSAAAESASDEGGIGSGGGARWTRFVFNKEADLDERDERLGWAPDGAAGAAGPPGGASAMALEKTYNSHGMGADLNMGLDDDRDLRTLSFRRTGDLERRQQALKRAEAQHEDAIFGSALPPPPPLPPPSKQQQQQQQSRRGGDGGREAAGGRASRPEQDRRPPRGTESQREGELRKTSDCHRDRDRDRDEHRDRGRNRDEHRDRDRDRDLDCDRDRDRGQGRDRNRDRDRDRDRRYESDRQWERSRERDRDRDRGWDRDRDRDCDRGQDRDRDRENGRDRDREQERERDRSRERVKDRGTDRQIDQERGRGRDRDENPAGPRDRERTGVRNQDHNRDQDPGSCDGPGHHLRKQRGRGSESQTDVVDCTAPQSKARPGPTGGGGSMLDPGSGEVAASAHPTSAAGAATAAGHVIATATAAAAGGAANAATASTVNAAVAQPTDAGVLARRLVGLADDGEDGPVVVELDEQGALAAAQAAAGEGSWTWGAEGKGRPGVARGIVTGAAEAAEGAPGTTLGGTLSSAVLKQQGMSWRDRALQARGKAAAAAAATK